MSMLDTGQINRYFSPCPRGLEAVLADELRHLGATDVEPTDGGAHFGGSLAICYRVNLETRIASRVLWRIVTARYSSEDDVYRIARSIGWPEWFAAADTLRVNVTALRSPVKSLNFITLRIKDAICDRFREHGPERPSIDTEHPDVRVHAF